MKSRRKPFSISKQKPLEISEAGLLRITDENTFDHLRKAYIACRSRGDSEEKSTEQCILLAALFLVSDENASIETNPKALADFTNTHNQVIRSLLIRAFHGSATPETSQ